MTKGVASIVPGNGTTGYHGSMGPDIAGEVGRDIIDHYQGTATEIIGYEYVPCHTIGVVLSQYIVIII